MVPPLIFDRKLLRMRRDKAAAQWEQHHFLKRKAAEDMAERLGDIGRVFNRLLDIGCHQGEFTRALKEIAITPLPAFRVSMDSAEAMVKEAEGYRVCADEEYIPLKRGAFDLVTSVLSLHWVNDIPGLLKTIHRLLCPEGWFMANIFGEHTLTELRQVFAKAEMQLWGGISPHVIPFMEVKTLGQLLQQAGFAMPVTDTVRWVVTYPSLHYLLADIRGMGEAHVLKERGGRFLGKGIWGHMDEVYRTMFPDGEGGIKATFDIVTMTGVRTR